MALFKPYAFFDPPMILDAQVTPIPGAASPPLQVISNSGNQIGVGVTFADNTGRFIGVYVGAPGQESLVCIIGNGHTSQAHVYGIFPQYSRVSLRSMDANPVTSGTLVTALVTS